MQAVVEVLLHVRRIQHRQAAGLEDMLRLVRQRRRLGGVVIAGQHQHAAVARRPGRVRVLEHIPGAVHTRPLAVPHAEHAVELRIRVHIDLLRTPDRRRGEVLVQAGLEHDIVRGEMLLGFPQRLVQRSERRPAVAGNEAGRIQAGGVVALLLQHRQAYQRLRAADIDAATVQRVLVVEGNVSERAADGVADRSGQGGIHRCSSMGCVVGITDSYSHGATVLSLL